MRDVFNLEFSKNVHSFVMSLFLSRKKLLLFIVVEYNNNKVYYRLSHDVVTYSSLFFIRRNK